MELVLSIATNVCIKTDVLKINPSNVHKTVSVLNQIATVRKKLLNFPRAMAALSTSPSGAPPSPKGLLITAVLSNSLTVSIKLNALMISHSLVLINHVGKLKKLVWSKLSSAQKIKQSALTDHAVMNGVYVYLSMAAQCNNLTVAQMAPVNLLKDPLPPRKVARLSLSAPRILLSSVLMDHVQVIVVCVRSCLHATSHLSSVAQIRLVPRK
jgi:hypothetical protein